MRRIGISSALTPCMVATRDQTCCGLAATSDSKRSPIKQCSRALRAADGQPFDLQRRLPYADGHALPILAADPDARVDLEILADHGHAVEHFGTVADQRRAFH